MKQFGTAALAAAVMLATGATASASVLIDHGPVGTYAASWSNTYFSQNFLVQVEFGTKTTINGFGVYTPSYNGHVNQFVRLKIRPDVAGAPDSDTTHQQNYYSFLDSVTPMGDTNLATAHFAPIVLDPGTYWIGMSGSEELGWAAYDSGGPGYPANEVIMFGDNVFSPGSPIYDLPYQVLGDAVPVTPGVPEPATWAMLIVGFGLAGAVLRRAALA